jgi:hypothetical protein
VIPLGASTAAFSVSTTAVSAQSAATIKATANGRFTTGKLVINP